MVPLVLLLLAGEPQVTLEAPEYLVPGERFRVRLVLAAPALEDAELPGWTVTPAAFELDGKALGERGKEGPVAVAAGERKTVEIDLGERLAGVDPGKERELALAWRDQPPVAVRVLARAPQRPFLDETAVPVAELASYRVLVTTNRGQMLVELWPDVAPNHVRNFLDLAQSGFYDGTTFHRVIPGFMIQGGDPDGNGSGRGPRRLDAEFSAREHVPGVLSMARTEDPNSASCQFFVVHARSPELDGQYSAFGRLVTGLETVERIAKSPRGQHDRPLDPQVIERMTVVQAPAAPDSNDRPEETPKQKE